MHGHGNWHDWNRYSSIHSLTSALEGGEWSASQPGRFTPRESAPGTHPCWVGPSAVLDAVNKRKIPRPAGNRILEPRSSSPARYRPSNSGSPSHTCIIIIYLHHTLDNGGSRVRFPAGAGNFSLHHRVQNGSGAHPASYPMGTRSSFSVGKAAGAWSWPLTSI
jgi:hypothetical protein